jgi:hypothetical protein
MTSESTFYSLQGFCNTLGLGQQPSIDGSLGLNSEVKVEITKDCRKIWMNIADASYIMYVVQVLSHNRVEVPVKIKWCQRARELRHT